MTSYVPERASGRGLADRLLGQLGAGTITCSDRLEPPGWRPAAALSKMTCMIRAESNSPEAANPCDIP